MNHIILIRIKIFLNRLNWFIYVLLWFSWMNRITVLWFSSIFIWESLIRFTPLHVLSWSINIHQENPWFDSYILWIVSIFIASDFPIFMCLNRFILSMIRIISLVLPQKLHLLLMSIYSYIHTLLNQFANITIESPSASLSTCSWD